MKASKPRLLLRTKLVLISVLALAVVSGVFLMPNHVFTHTAAANENIQIPSGSIEINTVPDPAAGPNMVTWTYVTLTVDNIGSVPVTISTIYVQREAFSYSSNVAPGTFSAASNQIQPGQSLTFTVMDSSSPTPFSFLSPSPWNLEAITSNGTTASTAYSWG